MPRWPRAGRQSPRSAPPDARRRIRPAPRPARLPRAGFRFARAEIERAEIELAEIELAEIERPAAPPAPGPRPQ